MSTIIPVKDCQSKVAGIDSQLVELEKSVFNYVLSELIRVKPGRDRAKCDPIFSYYTQAYVVPCISKHLASRVANVGGDSLIQNVLALEKKMGSEFHKGVLFHDTAVANLISGNEDGYEYLLAMTDEEEVKTQGGAHKRGTMNLLAGNLAKRIVAERMGFACEWLNGNIAGHAGNYAFLTARPQINATQLDAWRLTLEDLHQFEFLRIIHDVEVFLGLSNPDYQAAKENPFVMLRLAKALAHLAQWVESCLTDWQGAMGSGETLGVKLKNLDNSVGNALSAAATGSGAKFVGKSGLVVDAELQQLLADLAGAPPGVERNWRLLRILYITRNSTAHTIETSLAMYTNRAFLLNLIQAVFVSVFVICQLKGRPIP